MRTRIHRTAVLAVAIAAIAGPAAAQSPSAAAPASMGAGPAITEVISGLDSPRGIAVAADGTLYVAESGTGGTDPCITHPELGNVCFGPTGGVSKISGGTATRIVDGVLSAITDGGETFGPSDVIVAGDGTVWYLAGGPAAGAAETRALIPGGEGLGQLYKVAADGTATSVADLAAFESANNPDAAQPGNELPDSNVNGLAATADGGVAVADAGANDLLLVDKDGAISVAAVFPVRFAQLPPDPTASMDPNASPAMVPMDPVPTAVAVGPDGAYYVGELTGFPFPKGGASVMRVEAGSDPTPYASGFTNIMDLAFDAEGALYVLELAHDGLLASPPGAPPAGGLWRVPAGGGDPALVVSEGLVMPGGLAIATDGTIYITTCAVCPGVGGVVSLQP